MPLELLKELGIFIVALFLLVKSADYFVNYSEKLGKSLGVPQFIIGVTIISIGTSLPELVTSIFSIMKGETGFVAGNVIGSNIANILLIIGVTTVIAKKIEVTRSIIRIDLPLLIGSGAILVLTMKDGIFTFPEAVLSIVGFIVYIIYNITQRKGTIEDKEEKILKKLHLQKLPKFKWSYVLWIALSAVVLYFSAGTTIDSVISLGGMLNIDTAVIAVTAVAIGTSLPELLVSITAARKNNFEMALGNILGSNIFNGFMVMGVSGLITDLPVPESIMTIGIPFFIIATILISFSGIEKKFYNFEGALYLIIYALFIGQLFNFI